jgi:hypothetical protein
MVRTVPLVLAALLSFGGVAAAAVVPAPPAPPDDEGFTPAEESAEALFEALVMSASKLLQEGGPADAALSFSGSVSEASWEAALSGAYAGEPVSLSFSASYDPAAAAGSFTATGTWGEASWSGSGSWSYVRIDPATLDMSWDSEALIEWPWRILRPDKHFTRPKRWARSRLPDGSTHVVDDGSYRSTFFGIPFGPVRRQISDWVYPPGGGGIATVTVSLPDEAIALTGYADFGAGTVGGTVSLSGDVLPEPVPEEVEAAAAQAGAVRTGD